MIKQRLQKVLSQTGLGSRREIERLIVQELIYVNGIVAKLGDCVDNDAVIRLRGKVVPNPLTKVRHKRVLLYHKPVGEICSTTGDSKHTKTVCDRLPPIKDGRWIMLGRLDINTSGLLIFANDGALVHQMLHPSFGLEREYAVRVYGQVTKLMLDNLRTGVMLEDGLAKFKSIRFQGGEGNNSWYTVVLTEGRNREVRRLWATQEIVVSRLIRIRYGSIILPRWLGRGQFTELTRPEVVALIKRIVVIQEE